MKGTSLLKGASLKEIFGRGGLLSKVHGGYEFRPGQLAMATAVSAAIEHGEHLCVEAGTGTGKTLAYLIPALLSGKRTVVSTATKNLQEQLYFKDIPFIRQHLMPDIRVCVMKGRSNYVCLKKLDDFIHMPALFPTEETELFEAIRPWTETTASGDRAELDLIGDHSPLWRAFDAGRETCVGQECEQLNSCWVIKARRQAQESDLVIVNHALFFADLSLRNQDIGNILPNYSVAIFDEAHEMEGIATQYFGSAVSNLRLADLVHDLGLLVRKDSSFEVAHRQLETSRNQFFSGLKIPEGRHALEQGGPARADLARAAAPLLDLLQRTESQLAMGAGQGEDWARMTQRVGEVAADLRAALIDEDSRQVCWLDRTRRMTSLHTAPIDLAPILGRTLFERVPTAILTSATLTVENGFDHLRRQLGIHQGQEVALDSEFDYESQAMLYIPAALPEPSDARFAELAAREIEKVLEVTSGRAFLLFTSYAQMEKFYSLLRVTLPYPLLKQGDMPRSALLRLFKETQGSVLFATSSFWQGVDVVGASLSCVIIDKLPFSVPTDPLVAARCRHIEQEGGNAFYDYVVPDAVITLKQGLGRLIRSRSDRGILGLLDRRILCKRYGSVFLKSLPKCRLTDNISELSNFFGPRQSE